MTNFEERPFAFVGCGVVLVAGLFHIIGYACPNWVVASDTKSVLMNMGVWKACHKDVNDTVHCTSSQQYLNEKWGSEWIQGIQALTTLGLIAVCICMLISVADLAIPKLKQEISPVFIALVTGFMHFGFTLSSVIVYGLRQHSDLDHTKMDWAYILVVIAMMLTLMSSVMFFYEFYRVNHERTLRKKERRAAEIATTIQQNPSNHHNQNQPVYTRPADENSNQYTDPHYGPITRLNNNENQNGDNYHPKDITAPYAARSFRRDLSWAVTSKTHSTSTAAPHSGSKQNPRDDDVTDNRPTTVANGRAVLKTYDNARYMADRENGQDTIKDDDYDPMNDVVNPWDRPRDTTLACDNYDTTERHDDEATERDTTRGHCDMFSAESTMFDTATAQKPYGARLEPLPKPKKRRRRRQPKSTDDS